MDKKSERNRPERPKGRTARKPEDDPRMERYLAWLNGEEFTLEESPAKPIKPEKPGRDPYNSTR